MRILVFSGSYLPTRRSGGTVRAIEGLVSSLGSVHEFRIIALDRDPGSTSPFPGVCSATWQPVGGALVYYVGPRELTLQCMTRIVQSLEHDLYYVNSFLSPWFGIGPVMLRWAGAIADLPLVLAPRGELQPAALGLKRLKKRLFLAVARKSGAYVDVHWQAGSKEEAEGIRGGFGRGARISIARDLTTLGHESAASRPTKRRGSLSLACLARITPIKNIVGALRMLRHVEGDVEYDVYGPIVERAYFEACDRVARTLPNNVRVRFPGEIPNAEAIETMASYHALFMPTLGESFGHAILESLLAGCLLIISDQTPWKELRKRGVGWDVPLSDSAAFQRVLQTCVDMGDEEFAAASARARAFGLETVRDSGPERASLVMFEEAGRVACP